MGSDQPDLFNLPPTRLEEVTLHDWDVKHHALARQLHAEASPERQAAWWSSIIQGLRAYRAKRRKEALKGTP